VRALFATIERDGRHEEVSIMEIGEVPERLFSRWAMARVSADGDPDIPLIARTDGISPAASRGYYAGAGVRPGHHAGGDSRRSARELTPGDPDPPLSSRSSKSAG
jgi:Sensors of blue-light using FAD